MKFWGFSVIGIRVFFFAPSIVDQICGLNDFSQLCCGFEVILFHFISDNSVFNIINGTVLICFN